ncbi:MAG: SgcJ/EcaC family oxidoreductase [Pirellulales bacterium]|nr:SgcJ/EcaC family oxidoreductase [Pirellulales bacterium]
MIQRFFYLAVMTAFSTVLAAAACLAQDAAATNDGAAPANDDLAAVRTAVEKYVQAFNAGDAEAVAQCWGAEGVYITPEGERLKGPDAIKQHFADSFSESPGLQLTVTIDSLRLLGDDVALEEGTASVGQEGVAEETSTYVAVHHKHDGVWKLDTVRETVVPDNSGPEHALDSLAWLVGEWTDNSLPGVQVDSSYRWATGGQFLVNTFRVVIDDEIDMEGTQIIGWDPSRDTIRSWLFDSDGGFGQGTWTEGEEGEWLVETKNVLPDGRHSTSINHYQRVDDDQFSWSSTKRRVELEKLPDVAPIAVRRAGSE